MIDSISEDKENSIEILNGTDNTFMLTDVAYELDLSMADNEYSNIWEEISDQA